MRLMLMRSHAHSTEEIPRGMEDAGDECVGDEGRWERRDLYAELLDGGEET